MDVCTTLEEAGVRYVRHTHPPIRGEADLHLTELDWTTSVKTLAFELPEGRVALVGVPGPARLRFGDVARALGVARAQLRPASAEVVRSLGMEPGGVSPVCADPAVVLLLDEVVPGMGLVYCGGGSPELTIEVDAAELLRIAGNPVVAPITG